MALATVGPTAVSPAFEAGGSQDPKQSELHSKILFLKAKETKTNQTNQRKKQGGSGSPGFQSRYSGGRGRLTSDSKPARAVE